MNRFLAFFILVFLFYSCKKSTPAAPIAQSFIGNWKVYESVDQSSTSTWHVANDTFTTTTGRINDTTFVLIQSNRNPVPAWVGAGAFSADSLWVNPIDSNRHLINNFQGDFGTYSQNKDTLHIFYVYAGPTVDSPWGPNGSVYWVTQQWVRQ